jgi:hypothetical protein
LIARFEKKIQATLARVWGEGAETGREEAGKIQAMPSTARVKYAAGEAEDVLRVAEGEAGYGAKGKTEAGGVSVRGNRADRANGTNGTDRTDRTDRVDGTDKGNEKGKGCGREQDSAPVPIDQTDREEVLAKIREVFGKGGTRDRETALREVAEALGYGRLGANIRETLETDLLTAVRRGILENEGGELSLCCRSIEEYERDFLKDQFAASMGRGWIEREEAARGFARWMGFRRTGEAITEVAQSLINGLLRDGRIEKDGPNVRRR